MKEVSVISRTTPARPRSKNYVQGTAIYGGGGSKDILIPTNYIRDDQDDGTNYLLYVGTFLDSMKEGTGIGLFPEGRAQADKFEARKQIQIGEAMLFWDDANKAIGIKRVAVPASEDGTGEIKESEIGVYSQGWMSAKGIDKGEEEGTGGATTIGQLVNVGEWADQTASYDRILVQLSGSSMWTEKKLSEIGGGIDEEQLATYLTENNYAKKTDIPSLEGYATETWVTNKGYITSAALTGYATQDWVLSKSYATTSDLDERIDALVNGAPAAFDTLKEIADVLQGNVDSIGDIITTLGTKADKTITITAGTGLTGGGNLSANRTISLATIGKAGTYTKVVVDAYGRVTDYSSLSASDIPTLSISKISGLQDELDSKLEANVFNDLFEKVEIRSGVYAIRAKYGLYSNEFISAKGMDEGEGGGGSGSSYLSDLLDVSLSGLAVNDMLKWNGTKWVNVPQSSIVPSLAWENISGKPSWIGSSKPTYTFSEITSKPTTVKGYGITDAVTINDDQEIKSDKKWASTSSDVVIGFSSSGSPIIKHVIHTTAGWARGYSFVNSNTDVYCIFGAYGQGENLLYQYVGNDYQNPWQKWNETRSDLSVPLYINNYKVWHGGNVGSGSGLNADLLDGVHKEGLFTNLGSSTTTKLSITIGGTTKSLTSLYASHADTVRITSCNNAVNSGLWDEIKTSTKNGTLNVYDVYNNGGPTTYGNLIEIVSTLTNHWQPQLWFSGGANGNILHRNKEYNSDSFGDWFTILDSRNYTSFVKKIGTDSVGSNVNPIYLNAGVPTKSSYSFGNASGNIPISNGTLCTNLNADKLDGVDKTGLLTALSSNSTTNLSITVGGTTKSIVDLFANTAYKLETARTIWGQSFDGTKNISGAISGATTINASGSVTFGSTLSVTGLITATAGLTTPQYLQVGDGRIYWDSTNKALYVKHKDGSTAIGFYSKGWMSAKGIDSGTGGSTGGGNFFGVIVNGSTYRVDDEGYVTIPDYPTSLNWSEINGKPSWIGSSKPSYAWSEITGKPSSFTPSSHTHTKSQISDFPTTWAWVSISGKPTTLAGYGISDGVNSVSISGSGNAVTSASISGHILTLTKGSTFLLSSQYTANDILTKLKTVDGEDSGLDADLLDGYHGTSYDLSTNLGNCVDFCYYVIGLLQITDYNKTGNHANGRLSFIRSNGNNGVQQIQYSLSTFYNTVNVRFSYIALGKKIAKPCTFTYNSKKWAGFVVKMDSSYSNGVICTRFGLRNSEKSNPFLLKYYTSNTETINNSEVYNSLIINGGDIIEDEISAGNFVGNLSGNASSASKLETSKTIWGQSFDGTANVSGALTGVTNITASGSITAQKMYITGTANSNAYITADTSYNMYFVANGLSLLSLDGSQKTVRSGSGYASQISLGTATVRWSNLYSVAGNFSGAVTMASTLSVTGALTAKGGVNFNGSEITNVNRITFAAGDAGRKTVITNGGSFLLYAATGGWAGGLGYYSNDGSSYLGNAAGAYGGGNIINYFYYGGSYSSPKMVILPSGNVGIGTTAPTQKLHVAGNILATGAITAKAVSDIRLKTIIQEKVDYRKKLLGLGSVVDFYYNDKAIDRNTGAVDEERHIGLIYQQAKTSKLVNFCHEDEDGFGSINYLSTDYINLIAGALQQTIRQQETIEQRIARLEKENKDLKIQLNKLSA